MAGGDGSSENIEVGGEIVELRFAEGGEGGHLSLALLNDRAHGDVRGARLVLVVILQSGVGAR